MRGMTIFKMPLAIAGASQTLVGNCGMAKESALSLSTLMVKTGGRCLREPRSGATSRSRR